MATTKEIDQLMRLAREADGMDARAVYAARRALRAQQRARSLARLAKWSVGVDRPLLKEQAGRAAQRANTLTSSALRPTIAHEKVSLMAIPNPGDTDDTTDGAAMVETEEERRYELDQITASAALEGAQPSPAMQKLLERLARGEITESDFARLADELTSRTDYVAAAAAAGEPPEPTPGQDS